MCDYDIKKYSESESKIILDLMKMLDRNSKINEKDRIIGDVNE
jgi:hypothetical protein